MTTHLLPSGRWLYAAVLALAAGAAQAVLVQPTSPADHTKLAAAIDSNERPAADKARDGARHPQATLEYFGLASGQSVIEIEPGGGWYTQILAPFLRPRGHYYAALPSTDTEEGRRDRAAFDAKVVAHPERFGKVHVGSLPVTGRFTDIAPPGGADRVLTFRNIHNWMEAGNLDDMLRAFHAVLKPGGVLGIEEHRAPPGTTIGRMIATGYVTEEFVILRARAAGFRLAGHAEINANPRDDHDHPNGVWSLPPTLRGGAVERDKFVAIGESDRMTLRFIKQGK
jgi:predicted methyltransferase